MSEPQPIAAPRAPLPPAAAWSRPQLAALLGIAAVAAALRLWHLEQWSLSPEEALVWRAATEPLGGADGFFASERSRAPLLPLLLRWLLEAGVLPFHGEGWLRLPAAFVGIATVPLLALAAAPLAGRAAALLAAAALAVHPAHVLHSQSAAPPVFGVAAAVLAVAAAGWRTAPPPLRATALGLAAALALLAAPAGWLVAAALLVGWADRQLQRRGTPRGQRLAAAAGLSGLAAAAALLGWLPWPAAPAPGGPGDGAAAAAWAVGAAVWLFAALGPWLGGAPLAGGRTAAALGFVPAAVAAWLAASGHPPAAGAVDLGLPALLVLAGAATRRTGELLAAAAAGRGPAWLPPALAAAALLLPPAAGAFLYHTAYGGGRAEARRARDLLLRLPAATPLRLAADRAAGPLLYYLAPNHWRRTAAAPRFVVQPLAQQEPPPDALVWQAGEAAPAAPAGFRLLAVLPRPQPDGDATLWLAVRRAPQ